MFSPQGHLSPDAAFVYNVQQDATYYFANVAPQFQVFILFIVNKFIFINKFNKYFLRLFSLTNWLIFFFYCYIDDSWSFALCGIYLLLLYVKRSMQLGQRWVTILYIAIVCYNDAI